MLVFFFFKVKNVSTATQADKQLLTSLRSEEAVLVYFKDGLLKPGLAHSKYLAAFWWTLRRVCTGFPLPGGSVTLEKCGYVSPLIFLQLSSSLGVNPQILATEIPPYPKNQNQLKSSSLSVNHNMVLKDHFHGW